MVVPRPTRDVVAPRIDSYGEEAIQRALSEEGLYCTWNSLPYFRIGGTWRPFESPAGLRSELIKLVALVSPTAVGEVPVDQWFSANTDPEEPPALSLRNNPNCILWGSWPTETLGSLVAPQERSHVHQARGILRHPIIGEPKDFWIESGAPLAYPDNSDYEHLQRLFSGLELDPRSHVAVYCFLLGAFHARSLSEPRPILLIDSWSQGRGKSEVCAAIARLIDDNEGAIPARHGENQEFFDALGARFRTARTATVDNIDGVREWNNTLLANAASGTLSLRWKYARQEALIDGAMLSANLVVGQASIHEDMLSRMVRCELRGAPKRLHPQPQVFARSYRRELQQEILCALNRTEPEDDLALSRTAAFDAVGIAAYSEVFQTPPAKVAELLESARKNSQLHNLSVLEHLFCYRGKAFARVNDRVFRDPHLYNARYAEQLTLPDVEGVTALGYVYQNGEWKCI